MSRGTKPIKPYLGRVDVNKPRVNDWNLKFNNFTKDLEGSYLCNSYFGTDVKELKRYNISVVRKYHGRDVHAGFYYRIPSRTISCINQGF